MGHPVFVRGPGAGSDPADYEDMLRQWASHGFVVYSEVSSSSGDRMVDALDRPEDQNTSPSSPLYQDLDISEVAFGGHSRGVDRIMRERDIRGITGRIRRHLTQQDTKAVPVPARLTDSSPVRLNPRRPA